MTRGAGREISSSERYKYLHGCDVTFAEVTHQKHVTDGSIHLHATTYGKKQQS